MYISALIKAMKINFIFKINSFIWKLLLKLNNISVGKNFYTEGAIILKIRGVKNVCKRINAFK